MINPDLVGIREAKWEDKDSISCMLNGLGMNVPTDPEKVRKHWRKIWSENPDISVPHFGWVLEYQDEIVGFAGQFLRKYLYKGKTLDCSVAVQWGIVSEFRPFKKLLMDQFFYNNPCNFKIASTASPAASKLFLKYGSKGIPSLGSATIFTIPFNLENCVKYGKYPFLDQLLKATSTVLKLRIHLSKSPKNVRVTTNNKPVEGIDRFWNNFLKNYPDRLLACRSSTHLKWFLNKGGGDYERELFLLENEKDEIEGFAIGIEYPVRKQQGVKRYKIVDCLSFSRIGKRKLIKAVVLHAIEKKMDLLEIPFPADIGFFDIPCLTLRRKIKHNSALFHIGDKDAFLSDATEHWHMTGYDGDTFVGPYI